jgi:hypothetical protein
LAQSVDFGLSAQWPLTGVKRIWRGWAELVEIDP